MTSQADPDLILPRTTEILRDKYGASVDLQWLHTFPESPGKQASTVIRCRVIKGSPDLPSTLVIKKVRDDGGAKNGPYRPDSPQGPNIAFDFLNEWAALDLLQKLGPSPPIVPVLYAGDRSSGLLIMEDLGDGGGSNVEDALEGSDPEAASRGLLDLARTTGKLHGTTAGRAEDFYRIRYDLGPPPPLAELYAYPWDDARRKPVSQNAVEFSIRRYRDQCLSLGVQPHTGFDSEIERVTQRVENPSASLLALSQGDQNSVIGYMRCGSRLRMYDFDTAGYRHALREGVPARITWGAMLRVPPELVRDMDRAYQSEFAKGCPDMLDDNSFHRAMVEAGGHWHIFHVLSRLPAGLDRDPLRGATSLRTQVMGWIAGFAEMSEEFSHLTSLGRTAHDIIVRLRALWPADVHIPPLWPAFRL